MTKILIPRSDSISAKVVEPSDFEEMFSSDFMNDYVQTGFTITAGSGLAANISTGKARVKGLFIESDASATKSGLSASATNYIYITLSRDSNSEAQSWDFTSNTSGSTPTDSMVIGRAITNGSAVTSTNTTGRILHPLNLTESLTAEDSLQVLGYYYGDGSDGTVTISSNTNLSTAKNYDNLTINSGITLSTSDTKHGFLFIRVKGTLTINGIISTTGKGITDVPSGGAGGSKGICGSGGQNNVDPTAGTIGNEGMQGIGYGSTSGGVGGAGGGGGAGICQSTGAIGAVGASGGGIPEPLYYDRRFTTLNSVLTSLPFIVGGSGGSGGGGGGGGRSSSGTAGAGGQGGAGGKGGGTILIFAKTIVNSGSIQSNGASGTAGSAGAAQGGGGGGGGAGGHGGAVVLIYDSGAGGTVTASGGAGGSGGAAGAGGGYGDPLNYPTVAGTAGGTGGVGIVKQFQRSQ